jgi:pimeloyl-ACP methyl ester carboxylesterase
MTDAAEGCGTPIDDPNFLTRNHIDPALADAWRHVRLPHPVSKATEQLAEQLGYQITSDADAEPASERARAASRLATGDEIGPAGNRRQRGPGGNGSRKQGVLRETFLDANGLRLCICSWGPADGPAVLCLHGILDQGTCWELVARRLAQRGYRVVAPDLRGHGRSEHVGAGCAYHFPDFVADADAVLRTLGPEPVLLAGHSLGAVVATHLALARPERFTSLTAVEPPLRAASASPEQQRLTAYLDYAAAPPEHKPFADLQAAAERLQRAVPALSARLALRLARRSSEQTPEGRRWRWDAKLRTRSGLAYASHQLTRAAFQSAIAEIPLPVTVVQGSEGMTRWDVLPDDDASRVTCVTIDGGGHHLTIETPEQVAAAITNAMRVVGGVS